MDDFVKVVPDNLQKLARLVARGFYSVEHHILVDMLIRNPCMKEDDLMELLKFERKQLRTVIAQLKNDKFLKVKLKMETGPDGKATRQNYYYINYKVFVNVVKYKLDHMLRKIETEERDSTSRSSFKCPTCFKTFTDLEADQLCDFATGEFRCSFCNTLVDEDQSALPKQDSRMMLAKFNHQLEPLYNLLRDVEDIKLSPELLEPEPTDISSLRRDMKPKIPGQHPEHGQWSGDATRNRDFGMENTDYSISFGEDSAAASAAAKQIRKERPVWMVESTVSPEINDDVKPFPTVLSIPEDTPQISAAQSHKQEEDIMEVLLAHERKSGQSAPIIPGSDNANSSDSDSDVVNKKSAGMADVEEMDDDDDDEVTTVTIGEITVPLHEVTQELIARMTPVEKETYIKLSQEAYSNMYE